MGTVTNVVCDRCGAVMEIDAAKSAGWLIAANRDHELEELGEMVIRCTEHIDTAALVATDSDYHRYERALLASGPRKPRQVAIAWRGRVIDEFTFQPCGDYRSIGPLGLIGLVEEELPARGFRRTAHGSEEYRTIEN
jgi:hypothetical protein